VSCCWLYRIKWVECHCQPHWNDVVWERDDYMYSECDRRWRIGRAGCGRVSETDRHVFNQLHSTHWRRLVCQHEHEEEENGLI